MPLLDTKEYIVATVLAATAVGSISDVRYWNHAIGQYQTAAPTNVPFGQTVGAAVYGTNTSSHRQSMYFVLTLLRPDGSVKKTITTIAVAMDPGITMFSEILDAADRAGSWKARAELHGTVI